MSCALSAAGSKRSLFTLVALTREHAKRRTLAHAKGSSTCAMHQRFPTSGVGWTLSGASCHPVTHRPPNLNPHPPFPQNPITARIRRLLSVVT